ncbi:uncharacterized protein K489DRAFT_228333 [Dissoconium aciculare CBS 342.82]|uniref:Uncharacterized protein n=1 Tax=Dissoconium aciculare CBS 342.82 TaxID=1314786 RepID=A0A6J3M1Y8_9PEZI|nr:uncharacterized protein K489DRAFT_228333 [Dissoconium aciculare CBS 342.82]KAF1821918.1 hypothetical protein K489DRAFT_228333 [Dissoconium aciculare CBS 342.82]
MESILSGQTSSGELHADESVTFKYLTGDPNDSADRLLARVVVYSGAGRAVAAPAAEDSDGQMKPETLSFDLTHASRNDLRRSSSSSPTMTWGAREKKNEIRPSGCCFSTRGSNPLDLLQAPRVGHEPEGLPSMRAFRRSLGPSTRVHCDTKMDSTNKRFRWMKKVLVLSMICPWCRYFQVCASAASSTANQNSELQQ